MSNTKKNEEWVWVEGYKGTEHDMTCRGYKYDTHKQHDMPEDAKIKDCESGFHLCLTMKHVLEYYPLCNGNRYFKVKALVRKSDLDEYNKDYVCNAFGLGRISWNGYGYSFANESTRDKLVAKSIIFLEELSHTEVLDMAGIDTSEWTDDQKERAFIEGVGAIEKEIKIEKQKKKQEAQIEQLIALGYSMPFATYIVKNNKFEEAFAVGSQSNLSMDMKVLVIFRGDLED